MNDTSKNTISPYEIVESTAEEFAECTGCVFFKAKEKLTQGIMLSNCYAPQKQYDCTDNIIYVLAHRVSGKLLTKEEWIDEYTKHKQQCGIPL